MRDKLRVYIYSITMIIGIIALILMLCISFTSCGKVDNTGALRSSADIRAEQYHYLDDEAIALSDSMTDTGLRAVAYEAFNEVNDIRAEAGVDELKWDKNLETVADVRAKECSEKFSHTRPNGSQWYTVNSKIQGGENLAVGFDNAEDCVEAWMDSPTHRDNILDDEFEKVAISIYEEDGTYYWSQEYGY